MRSLVFSVFVCAASLTSLPAAAQPPQEVKCLCSVPPGGVCRCELDQIATCRIESNQCSSRCRDYKKNLTNEQLTVLILEDALGVPPSAFGLDPSGRRTNEKLAAAAMELLNRMLASARRSPSQVELEVEIRQPLTPGLPRQVRVSMPPDIEPRLRAAVFQ